MSTAIAQAQAQAQAQVQTQAQTQAQVVQALMHPHELQVQERFALPVMECAGGCGKTSGLATRSTCGIVCAECFREWSGN